MDRPLEGTTLDHCGELELPCAATTRADAFDGLRREKSSRRKGMFETEVFPGLVVPSCGVSVAAFGADFFVAGIPARWGVELMVLHSFLALRI